jgi:uncharacterized protein YbjT (DUF2867 family)
MDNAIPRETLQSNGCAASPAAATRCVTRSDSTAALHEALPAERPCARAKAAPIQTSRGNAHRQRRHQAPCGNHLDTPAAQGIKRILLLGATGRTGRHVLDYALKQGLEVSALVRSPDRVAVHSDRLAVRMGSPLNPSDVAEAIEGCDAVVSTLSHIRTSDWPWSKAISPPLLLTHCIGNCIDAMRKHGVRRVVVMSAIGVGDSFAKAPAKLRWLILHTNLRRVYIDQDAQERMLSQSGLRWTIVRAATLTDGEQPGKLMFGFDHRPPSRFAVSREWAARFVVDCLSSARYIGETPMISACEK